MLGTQAHCLIKLALALRQHRVFILPSVLFAAAVFGLWCLGGAGLGTWDESRYGENALEMLRTGDFINYYWHGAPDGWVAKPPLGIWAMALSFKLFGLSEWSLRLPSALAGFGAIWFEFALVKRFRSPLTAASTSLILLTSHGIIGPHVARTGDLDALFIFTALGMLYFLAAYLQTAKGKDLVLAGGFCGLCFFTKGLMVGILMPGIFLSLCLLGRLKPLLKDPAFYLGLTLALSFAYAWYFCVKHYGIQNAAPHLGADAWDTMIGYDAVKTFTEKIEVETDRSLIISALDQRFSPWIYLLLADALVLASAALRRRHGWRRLVAHLRRDTLTALSAALTVGTCAVLVSSSTCYNWYFAVTTPFLAVLTYTLHRHVTRLWPKAGWAYGATLLVALAMQGKQILLPPATLARDILLNERLITGAQHVYTQRAPADNSLLALRLRNKAAELAPAGLTTSLLKPVTSRLAIFDSDGGYSVLLSPGPSD